jgi:hypothetical protein
MSAAVWSEALVAECGRRDARRVGGGPWEAGVSEGIPIVRAPHRTALDAAPHPGEPSTAETA